VNIGSAVQIANGPKRGQKKKWDKNPPKDKLKNPNGEEVMGCC